jgi:hypothetical protein
VAGTRAQRRRPGLTRTDGALAELGDIKEELGRTLPLGRITYQRHPGRVGHG